jgi:hypothetical protein
MRIQRVSWSATDVTCVVIHGGLGMTHMYPGAGWLGSSSRNMLELVRRGKGLLSIHTLASICVATGVFAHKTLAGALDTTCPVILPADTSNMGDVVPSCTPRVILA